MAQVFLGMSGGVDSSAAAVLLLERGYCVHGLHLSLLNTLPLPENCPPEDGSDARAVAQALELPFHDLDLSERFRQTVAAYFIREYEAGRTPNPCVFCNREIKFGAMWDAAQALGADYLATGHYANAARDPVSGRYLLRRGADRAKDQSYFLCRLTQEQLSHTLFPLGGLTKPQVRELAEARGLPTARKRDSQDICFVPDGDYAKVIENRTGKTPEPGPFLDLNGNVVGTHRGIIHYTVGQRRGLRMPSDGKIYVVKILPERNAVVVGPNEALFTRECLVPGMHWISGEAPALPFRCSAKTRYRQPEQPCTVYPAGERGIRLVFDEPLRAITPGQSAVLYDGDTVLGGGIIAREESVC